MLSEQTGKIAGYKYLKDNWSKNQVRDAVKQFKKDFPKATKEDLNDYKEKLEAKKSYDGYVPWEDSETELGKRDLREIASRVRKLVGTPDVFRRGLWTPWLNNIFLFSNVNKEGMASMWRAYKEDPMLYAWKTIQYNILPSALLAAYYSMWASEDEKRKWEGIPKYYKDHYLTIPLLGSLGVTKDNKTNFIAIPLDYEGQYWHFLVQRMIDAYRFKSKRSEAVYDVIEERVPFGLPGKSNPLYSDVIKPLFSYYAKGQNPIDDYTGRPVLSQRRYAAGGGYAAGGLVRHMWNSLGGKSIYYWRDQDYPGVKTDFEEITSIPPFNLLNVFFKQSNRGFLEQQSIEKEERDFKEGRQKMREYRKLKRDFSPNKTYSEEAAREVHARWIAEGYYDDRDEIPTFSEFNTQFRYRKTGEPFLDSLLVPGMTSPEKGKILVDFYNTLSAPQFEKIYEELKQRNIINPEFRLKNFEEGLRTGDASLSFYHLHRWYLEYGTPRQYRSALMRMNPYYTPNKKKKYELEQTIKMFPGYGRKLEERYKEYEAHLNYANKLLSVVLTPNLREQWLIKFENGNLSFRDVEQIY